MALKMSPGLIQSVNNFLSEYSFQINGFLGITILTCLFSLIFHLSKLGTSGTDKNMRTNSIKGILISGVCLAVLGSLSLWFQLLVSSNLN